MLAWHWLVYPDPNPNCEGATNLLLSNCVGSSGNTPAGEGPEKAIDGSVSTKWLDFDTHPLVLTCPQALNPTDFTFVTAHDEPTRDPVQWTLEGARSSNGPWMTLQSQTSTYSTPENRGSQLPWFELGWEGKCGPHPYLPNCTFAVGYRV